MDNKNEMARKKVLFSVVFVALCAVILLIIFLANKDKILTNLKETDFFGKIFGSTPEIIENHESIRGENEELPLREDFIVTEKSEPDLVIPGLKSSNNGTSQSQESFDSGFNENQIAGMGLKAGASGAGAGFDSTGAGIDSVDIEGIGSNLTEDQTETYNNSSTVEFSNNSELIANGIKVTELSGNASEESSNVPASSNIIPGVNNSGTLIKKDVAPKVSAIPTSTLDLCFVIIEGDGTVTRKMVKRSVPKSDSPLTTAINLLLEGPDVRNKSETECRSLIPDGSKLLSARVADGIAYLNFNDQFEFNPFGVEGSIHQLEQIVFTATSFSTVNSVQFLIEGNKREYLGSEGQWIGTPLSRSNF